MLWPLKGLLIVVLLLLWLGGLLAAVKCSLRRGVDAKLCRGLSSHSRPGVGGGWEVGADVCDRTGVAMQGGDRGDRSGGVDRELAEVANWWCGCQGCLLGGLGRATSGLGCHRSCNGVCQCRGEAFVTGMDNVPELTGLAMDCLILLPPVL